MNRFILGYLNLDTAILTVFDSAEQANYEAEEWCTVEADSLQEAKQNYESTFEEHKREGRIHGPF